LEEYNILRSVSNGGVLALHYNTMLNRRIALGYHTPIPTLPGEFRNSYTSLIVFPDDKSALSSIEHKALGCPRERK